MKKTNLSVLLYTSVLSIALLVPILSIPFIDHNARQKWERRKLNPLPEIKLLLREPKAAFSRYDDYIADHIGGSFQAIRFRKEINFKVFKSTDDPYIVRSADGALFLTAPFTQKERTRPFSWWNHLCITMQKPAYQEVYAKKLKASEAVLGHQGAKVIFTNVPTKSILLPGKLPRSTPDHIKQSCAGLTAQNNHIKTLQAGYQNLNMFYPIEAFKSRMNDPRFFPSTAYHWAGESNWVFTEAFAKEYQIDLPDNWPREGSCTPQDVQWDIGRLMGVDDVTPGCDRDRNALGLIIDTKFNYPVTSDPKIKSVRITKITNPNAAGDKTAVMFSNSFGPAVREPFAAQFKTFYHLNTNQISNPKLKLLLNNSNIMTVDYAIIVIGDFHYPKYLSRFEKK